MYFCLTGFLIRFVSWFLFGSSPVPVLRVDRFDNRSGPDNIGLCTTCLLELSKIHDMNLWVLIKALHEPLCEVTI